MAEDGFNFNTEEGNLIVKTFYLGRLLKIKLLGIIEDPGIEAMLPGVLISSGGSPSFSLLLPAFSLLLASQFQRQAP
jgi:hypothetical protein